MATNEAIEATPLRDDAPGPMTERRASPGTVLHEHEMFWRDLQPWLVERGYQLRPRFRPGWIPSWKLDGKGRSYRYYEDGYSSNRAQVLDATRTSDGEMVMLKRISQRVHPYEVSITELFSEEPLKSHPRNHCVPILEVLKVPNDDDIVILVLPLLRPFEDPRFQTIGEGVEFFRQIFEGLQFMHQVHVAHRDCMDLNIMMDPRPIYSQMYHPRVINRARNFQDSAKHHTRTARPVKYYLIDFGISRQYSADETSPLEDPVVGGDKTVPEFRIGEPCNPFPTDIYYLGNMIRENFLQKFRGFEFMLPLVADMVQEEPAKRPTIDQVVDRFAKLYDSLPWWKLRSRPADDDESFGRRISIWTRHFLRTTTHILTLRSALPRPPRDPLHTFTL